MPTTNPVPSTDPTDLLFNAGKLDEVVNGAGSTYTDRLGVTRRTIGGIDAEAETRMDAIDAAAIAQRDNIQDAADLVLAAAGYAPPVVYAAGISMTLQTQTVSYNGDTYAPKQSELPFTTSGTFETAKFRLIQGVASADLPLLVGQDLQDYTALRAYTGLAKRVYITGLLVTAKPAGIAGIFQYDPTDTTSADNGGTIIVGADGRRWKRDFSVPASVKFFGAMGNASGGVDDTASIQLALNSGLKDIYLPDGYFGVKSATVALTLSASDVTFSGPGYLVPLANDSGWAPQQMLLVSGSRNKISINLWNSADLGKRASDASNEYPMDGIRVTGSENTVHDCGVWNFVVPIVIRGGAGNKVVFNRTTTKQVSNLAWPNDGILWFQTNQGVCLGNECGLATYASQQTVLMTDVTGASTSTLRTGITLDAQTSGILVEGNHVGEGFVAGIHSEGTGTRRHTITGNFIYKQRRNGINGAGKRLVITENRCFGTFATDNTVNLTGIIGSIDGSSTVSNNTIECDNATIDGIRMLANTANVKIRGNMFEGTFQYCVNGVANNVKIHSNTLNGTAIRFANIDKPSAVGADASVSIVDNFANGITEKFAKLGSGAIGTIAKNKILMAEGYVAANGVIEFGGGYGSAVTSARLRIVDNDCSYIGTTSISGAFSFILSSASSATNLRAIIRNNSFDTSIWSTIISGSFVNGLNFDVAGNSTNASASIGARSGSFTLSSSATTNVANNYVSATSAIFIFPINAAAANLMQGAKSLYVSARVSGTRFDVTTADGTAAAGTEQFMYQIVD